MGDTGRTVGPPQAPQARGFPPTAWSQIEWTTAARSVQSLRGRIFRATQAPCWKQGRHLTKLLRRSDANRRGSVRRVTQGNRGRQTPGRDGACPTTPAERATLVEALRQYHPWTASPAWRVMLPKAHGQQRPLGLLPHRDRARQMVGKNAVEPRLEAGFEAQRDGFRPGRCCQEAIEAIYVALNNRAVGRNQDLLDADIHGACDHLSHDCLLPRIGPLPGRVVLKPWLKAGYWEKGTRHHTTQGTPQGGVRSPLLANRALEGLAQHLGKGSRVVRAADGSVVMAKAQQAIEQARPLATAFLRTRGLALNQDKTRLRHRTDGREFLGFHIQMRGKQRLSTPQKQRGQELLQRVRAWLKTHQTVATEVVIRHLNPLLRGWALDARPVGRKQTVQTVDSHLWRALWQWAQRRHPTQPKRWISHRDVARGKYGATFSADSRDSRGQPRRLW